MSRFFFWRLRDHKNERGVWHLSYERRSKVLASSRTGAGRIVDGKIPVYAASKRYLC